jgi:hypothetical protein
VRSLFYAHMVKLVKASDLDSGDFVGSNPTMSTKYTYDVTGKRVPLKPEIVWVRIPLGVHGGLLEMAY